MCGREDFQKWVVAGLISGCGGVATPLRLGFVGEEFDKWLSTLLSGLGPAISFFFSTATFIWPRSSFTALILLSRSVLLSLNAAEALPQQARGSSCLLGIITLNVTNDLLLDRRFPLSSFSGAFIPAWEHGVVLLAQLPFARTLYDSIVRSS